ncbi:MAG: hypothetical protein MRY83_11215, partial [Flavobacteriales bacterium]|nr:hypothetical protein [Flavobacteriales bacterium]
MSRFLMVALIVTALARQFGSAQNHNGRLDNLEEFTTMVEVPFTMPDGINLKTNVFLPIVQDCMIVRLNGSVNVFGFNIGIDQNIELIQKGTQIVIYDSLNGSPVTGDDRYKLPMVFTRTPYNKGSNLLEGSIFSIMGYGYAMQDMRGRYASEG